MWLLEGLVPIRYKFRMDSIRHPSSVPGNSKTEHFAQRGVGEDLTCPRYLYNINLESCYFSFLKICAMHNNISK